MFKRKHKIGPGIFDGDRWNEIFETILRNKRRSFFTAMGVFWGVFMLVVLMGIGMGLERLINRSVGDLSTNALYIFADQTSIPYKGMPSSRWWNLTMDDVDNIKRNIPEVKEAAALMWGSTYTFTHGEFDGEFQIMGYVPDYQKVAPVNVIMGRFINEIDINEKRKVCLIGAQVWKELFPGGQDPLGATVKMNSTYLSVVGVMEQNSSMSFYGDVESTVIVPITLTQQLYNYGTTIHQIAVVGYDDVNIETLKNKCRQVIAANHIISPDDIKAIMIFDSGEIFGRFQGLLNGVNILTWIVGLGTLLAGIVGISNIMLVTVRERTREIGVRRALGATPLIIITQILSESFILTFVSGLFALALGVGFLSVADNVIKAAFDSDISCQISFGLGIGALSIVIAGSLLAGIIPANRAIQIKAVDAIRDE